MNKKASKLQKKILKTIYLKGECEDLVRVMELNPEKVSVEYQLEKQRLVNERKGVFVREDRDIEGLLVKHYRVRVYKLNRSKLACLLFDWQKFNVYFEHVNQVRLKAIPEDYSAREVALTNSLKSLEAKGYIDFLDYHENKLELLGRK